MFGSYTQARYAETAVQQITSQLGVETIQSQVEVNGRTFIRVRSPVMDEFAARALIEQARASGFVGPWFLSHGRIQSDRDLPVVAAPATAPPAQVPETEPTTPAPASPPQPRPIRADEETVAVTPGEPVASTSRPPSANFMAPTLIDNPDKVVVTTGPDPDIRIDGVVDEAIWQQLPVYDNMLVTDPDTLATPDFTTNTRFFYTDRGLYISAVMHQPPDSLVERLSTRDEEINRDSFGITLDTSGEGLYGYWFELALGGSKADGKVLPERSFTRQWDGAWTGETAKTENGWSAEMYIPWSIMSMPSFLDKRRLTFWVQRKVAHANEQYGWPALPTSAARFMSALQPMEVSDVNPRQQWEIFPYVSGTIDEVRSDTESRAGVDIFWRPSSNFQVTATANPDFGAVESDDVVVNLTAFETFFPEKRLFFLEGTEVFVTSPRSNPTFVSLRSQGGRQPPPLFQMEPTTLLNTRRIGGSAKHVVIPDDVTVSGVEQSKPSELVGAVKMVGQAGGFRYGVLAAQEKEAEFDGTHDITGADITVEEDGRDFGVARMLYETSSAGGRRSIGWMGTMTSYPNQDDAMVQGIDTHFLSSNGRWSWDTQLVASDADDETGYGVWTDIGYTPRQGVGHRLAIDWMDDKLDISDLGFLRRNDTRSFRYSYFVSKSKDLPDYLQRSSNGLFVSSGTNGDGDMARSFLGYFTTLVFSNNGQFRSEIDWLPAHYDDRNARGNGTYKTEHGYFLSGSYGTDSSKKFSTSIQLGVRSEDLGDPQYFADWGFTWNPVHRFSLDLDLRWKKRNNWLIWMEDRDLTAFNATELSPSMSLDFFITAKQQLRMTMQWIGINADENEFYTVPTSPGDLRERIKDPAAPRDDFTISRLTAQIRYRWEIGPLSDLFVVYTRGSNLPDRGDDGFDDLFIDALESPIVDLLVLKLRYRFGS